jgi:hypothetical protein
MLNIEYVGPNYDGDQVKVNEMVGACNTCETGNRCTNHFSLNNWSEGTACGT